MSAGDGAHKAAATAAPPGDYYERTAALVAACVVDRGYTIPYLANRSRDGARVYIDESVPAEVAGVETAATLAWHELAEWLAMNDGLDYQAAHATAANPCERKRVEALGGDWTDYCDAFAPLIREVGDEAISRVPADLDLRPYQDEDDRQAMAELAAAGDAAADAARGYAMGKFDAHFELGRSFMRLATAAPVSVRAEGDRTIEHILSDESVARDGHTIATAGWRLDNFRKNPVYLWAHDSGQPPIGRFLDIGPVGAQLRGTVRYAERDEYPFADTIFRLTRGGFVNASSVSWLPIKWAYAADKSRPGGIDFAEQELLEASAVPVPALASALVSARAAGVDTGPIFDWASRALDLGGIAVLPRRELEILRKEAKMAVATRAKKAAEWKVGAARSLPLGGDEAWDGPAAEKTIFDHAGFDGDSPDLAFARKGFLAYDSANRGLKGSYKEPFAKVIDGRLTAMPAGVRAAASRLPQADLPDAVKDSAREVIDGYEKKIKEKSDGGEGRAAPKPLKRDLWLVGWLAMLLSDLGCIQANAEWEAAVEEDGSTVPDDLLAAMKALGETLIKMTVEEVTEMLAGDDDAGAVDGVIAYASNLDLKRAAFRALRRQSPIALAIFNQAMRAQLAGRAVAFTASDGAPLARSGRVLSADNERCLRDAHDHMTQASDLVRGVFEQVDDTQDDDQARALAARRAAALKRKAALPAPPGA